MSRNAAPDVTDEVSQTEWVSGEDVYRDEFGFQPTSEEHTGDNERLQHRAWTILVANFLHHHAHNDVSSIPASKLEALSREHKQHLDETFEPPAPPDDVDLPNVDTATLEHCEITRLFGAYKDAKEAGCLTLVASYRGFDIESSARVNRVGPDRISVTTDELLIRVLSKVRMVRIESPVHGTTLTAFAIGFDRANDRLSLSFFSKGGGELNRRTEARAQPAESIKVSMQVGEQFIEGELADVSVSALAVNIALPAPGPLANGDTLRATVSLPHPKERIQVPVEIPGQVMRISLNQLNARIVLKIRGNEELFKSLSEYIAMRRSEVYAEVLALDSQLAK